MIGIVREDLPSLFNEYLIGNQYEDFDILSFDDFLNTKFVSFEGNGNSYPNILQMILQHMFGYTIDFVNYDFAKKQTFK